MPIEIKKDQLRIRISNKNFSKYRTKDVGSKGRLQILLGYNPKTKKWDEVSYHINLMDYMSLNDVKKEINKLKISTTQKHLAAKKVEKWIYETFD